MLFRNRLPRQCSSEPPTSFGRCQDFIQGVSSSAAVLDWINSQGGERDRNVSNVVHLANIMSQSVMLNIGLDYTKATCILSRQWARVVQLAQLCRLSLDDLDRMYAAANPYRPN